MVGMDKILQVWAGDSYSHRVVDLEETRCHLGRNKLLLHLLQSMPE